MRWQVQEAKQRFSEVVREAIDNGPQVITRHAEEVAVVISMSEYRRLSGSKPDFKEFLVSGPRLDFDLLDLERSPDLPRDVDL